MLCTYTLGDISHVECTRYLERIKYTRRRIINKIRSYTILI